MVTGAARTLAAGLLFLATGVASADPITTRDLVEMRAVSGLAVSPDGAWAVVRVNSPSVASNRTGIDWWLVDTSGTRAPRLLGSAGEPILEGQAILNEKPQWAPDGTAFYYRTRRGQEIQVWRMNVADGAAAPVTHDAADVARFQVAADGRSLTYWTGPTRAQILAWEAEEDRVGVVYGDTIWPWAALAHNWLVGGRMATYRRYSVTGAGDLGSQLPQVARRLDLVSGNVADASLPAPAPTTPLEHEISRFPDPAGQGVAVITREAEGLRNPPYQRLFATVPGLAAPKRCAAAACLSQQLAVLGWRGREIVFAAESFAVAQSGLYGWDVRTDRVRRIAQTNGLLGALADNDRYATRACPMSARAAVCTFSSPWVPPRVEAISLSDGNRRVIFDPNQGLGERVGVKVEQFTWADKLGRSNDEGVLVLPADLQPGMRYPLVITLYRCRGFLTGSAGDGAPEYVMARLGFVVLCVEFNNDKPRIPQPATSYAPERYPAGLAQMEGAVDALEARGLVDRSRVGVTGVSMGGNLAAYAMSHAKLFSAAVLRHASVFEPEYLSQIAPGEVLRASLLKDYHLDTSGPERDKAWADVSASLRADRIDTATLIEANDSEYVGSLPVFSAMKEAGKPVEMQVFMDETHQLHQPVHRLINYDRTIDWLRFWLQGYEDPDPAKAAQYRRWRALPKLSPKP